MADSIKIKRGLQSAIDGLVLQSGEFAVALDTGNVYIGITSGKFHVNPKGGTADVAKKLEIERSFNITGDVIATAKKFDGTANVTLSAILPVISGLAEGTYAKVGVNAKGQVTSGKSLEIEDIPKLPYSKIIGAPTKVSDLLNDSNFQTDAQVQQAIAALVSAAPETLDTLKEIADALGNDPNFATSITTQIGTKEALIKNAVAKTTLANADTFPLTDSAASNATKKITFTNIKAGLKTYFDTLYNKYVHPTFTAKASGLYKITVNAEGHVSAVTAVIKSDITALGIPAQDTVYTLPTASTSVKGGMKIGTGLKMIGDVISVGDIDGGTF